MNGQAWETGSTYVKPRVTSDKNTHPQRSAAMVDRDGSLVCTGLCTSQRPKEKKKERFQRIPELHRAGGVTKSPQPISCFITSKLMCVESNQQTCNTGFSHAPQGTEFKSCHSGADTVVFALKESDRSCSGGGGEGLRSSVSALYTVTASRDRLQYFPHKQEIIVTKKINETIFCVLCVQIIICGCPLYTYCHNPTNTNLKTNNLIDYIELFQYGRHSYHCYQPFCS